MMRRATMWLAAFVVLASASSVVRADDLAGVKKKIESQALEYQTLRQESRMTMDMAGPAGKTTGTSTLEYARRGKDKWVSRSDMAMKSPKQDGQPGDQQTEMTAINDGQFIYTISEQGGHKMAMKMRADQGGQASTADPTGFAGMEKYFDLKLLPDQKVDGKTTWVIEARPKQSQAQPGQFDRTVMYYDQATCLLVKVLSYDKDGKVVSTVEVIKSQPNAKIPEDRFTVPAGVQVMDMTAAQGGAQENAATGNDAGDKPAEAPASAPAADKAKSAEAQPEPKKEEKPKDSAKKVLKKLF